MRTIQTCVSLLLTRMLDYQISFRSRRQSSLKNIERKSIILKRSTSDCRSAWKFWKKVTALALTSVGGLPWHRIESDHSQASSKLYVVRQRSVATLRQTLLFCARHIYSDSSTTAFCALRTRSHPTRVPIPGRHKKRSAREVPLQNWLILKSWG
jgi:hypothetical protein